MKTLAILYIGALMGLVASTKTFNPQHKSVGKLFTHTEKSAFAHEKVPRTKLHKPTSVAKRDDEVMSTPPTETRSKHGFTRTGTFTRKPKHWTKGSMTGSFTRPTGSRSRPQMTRSFTRPSGNRSRRPMTRAFTKPEGNRELRIKTITTTVKPGAEPKPERKLSNFSFKPKKSRTGTYEHVSRTGTFEHVSRTGTFEHVSRTGTNEHKPRTRTNERKSRIRTNERKSKSAANEQEATGSATSTQVQATSSDLFF
ncbi:hypothetical protein BB558_002548 [Smittium angustum]|uniref:Uncharacterized protein n=1 Tax=Smittium angustum TaxID=133377 RepID=A0A2U1IY05_SMIAN|nr:hypothetical protein BB558_006362 [Smittium angustum]PWA01362.1 hypothetical protein BB558_002548 [Smittium angustum]